MQKKDETLTIVSASTDEKNIPPLRESVETCLENYFRHLEGYTPCDIYQMVFDEVELSLLTFMMKYVAGNQCKASELLGINRGTLRKKLRQHRLI